MKLPTVILPILLFVSCDQADDSPPVESGTFANAYADLLKFAASDDSLTVPSERAGRQDSILSLHGLTRSTFNAAIDWHNSDVQRWNRLLEQVTRSLEEKDKRPGSLEKEKRAKAVSPQ